MATINEDYRSFLLGIPELVAVVGQRIYELHVPVRDEATGVPDVPFVWLGQAGAEYVRCTDDDPGQEPFRYEFDTECVANQVAEAIQIANIVRFNLDSYSGAFGTRPHVQVALVEDQSDTYVVRNPMADLGLSVASLAVSIIP